MSRKARILAHDQDQRKLPWDLTRAEVCALMQTFTRDKNMVYEADALTLCHWAALRKRGALELDLVLAGHLAVQVRDGEVQLELPWSRN